MSVWEEGESVGRVGFRFAAAVATLSVVSCVGLCRGATIRVPSESPTIQSGINVALDGDTVLVAPGVYVGPGNRDVRFNGKRILVCSEAGSENTVLDCQGSEEDPHRGFDFNSGETNESVLRGFTVTNGQAVFNGEPLSWAGSGIRISGSSGPIVDGCVVVQCRGFSAIYVASDNARIQECVVVDNDGMGIDAGRNPTIDGCTIASNLGGGLRGSDTLSILNSSVIGNEKYGVYLNGCIQALVQGCVIAGNRGGLAPSGGIACDTVFQIAIEGCTIVGNRVSGNGAAGVDLSGGCYEVAMANCIVDNNCDPDVRVGSECDLTFVCCAIHPGSVLLQGGTVRYSGPQVTGDPLICGAAVCTDAPTTAGNYALQTGSPCLPENSPCGELIGALGADCSTAGVPEVLVSDPALLVAAIPNPSRETVSVQFVSPDAVQGRELAASVRVFDVGGREINSLSRILAPGQDEVRLDVDELQPGTYFARVRVGDREGSTRFLVVR
ncbi:MAG: right-handed parallel beta-helix repeat-containing protein [Candidatus Eisenbacteria bacterium]